MFLPESLARSIISNRPTEPVQIEAVPVVELDAFLLQQALLVGVAAIAGGSVGHLALRVDDTVPGNIACRGAGERGRQDGLALAGRPWRRLVHRWQPSPWECGGLQRRLPRRLRRLGMGQAVAACGSAVLAARSISMVAASCRLARDHVWVSSETPSTSPGHLPTRCWRRSRNHHIGLGIEQGFHIRLGLPQSSTGFGVEDTDDQSLLSGFQRLHLLLDSAERDQPMDEHRLVLADAVRAVCRLILDRRVPPWVVVNDCVGGGQRQPDTTRA